MEAHVIVDRHLAVLSPRLSNASLTLLFNSCGYPSLDFLSLTYRLSASNASSLAETYLVCIAVLDGLRYTTIKLKP